MENISLESFELPANKPTYAGVVEIQVNILGGELITRYAQTVIKEIMMTEPLRFERSNLDVEKVVAYTKFLINERVKCVNGECKIWRQLKTLSIPVFVQLVLSKIGRFFDRHTGRDFKPSVSAEFIKEMISFDEAKKISESLEYFDDVIGQRKDAMPRGEEGDQEVMSTILVADHVYGIGDAYDPKVEYITAFLNFQVSSEVAWSWLYTAKYDDVKYIYNGLCSRGVVRR
jgi:hypothetical protein